MAIKLQCPRCNGPLAVPNSKAGSYVNCPICKGRLWVPKDAPADAVPIEAIVPQGSVAATVSAPENITISVTLPAPPAPPPPVPSIAPDANRRSILPSGRPPVVGPSVVPPPVVAPPIMARPTATSQTSLPPVQTPAVPPPGASKSGRVAKQPLPVPEAPPQIQPASRKVARFVSAEAARSTLKPAEDGKLPELYLSDGDQREKAVEKTKSLQPLVLFGVLALSVGLSIALVLVDVNPQSATKEQMQADARQTIKNNFFGSRQGKGTLERYQVLLREAQIEHDQGNYKTERAKYREVLKMIRAEHGAADLGTEKGLTGSRKRDKELEENISLLLDN
jgi:hypothetical protein